MSEADYFWPDLKNPDCPYIQRDEMSNPGNLVEHCRFLMRLSLQVPALTAPWQVTGQKRYAAHAERHLRAWFIDPATLMTPNLQYAQAILGRSLGAELVSSTPFIWLRSRERLMRHCALLFAGLAFGRPDYLHLCKTLQADSTVDEVVRNFFIHQPVLWVNALDRRSNSP